MDYILVFHANLNYAYLTPDRYEFVIRNAYEMTIDTMRDYFPDAHYVFEASGYTLDQIALYTPDVLTKLTEAIACGQCEFMGSPYAHPMLPNFPYEDGIWSIRFSNKTYQKHLGFVPRSFWNPECGWKSYVPKQIFETGYKNLVGDFEAYCQSCMPDGKPLRPEFYEKEVTKKSSFYNFGFQHDLPGHEKTIHFPFETIHGLGKKLKVFLRTDRICQFGVRYFMGMEGYSLEKYMELIKTYSQHGKGESKGALIIFADDAEYIGTNGWFRLKYQNKPDNVFEATPQSKQKLIDLITQCLKIGQFTTFDYACKTLPALKEDIVFDDDSAWHGAKASTWACTPMARLLRPWQELVRNKLQDLSHEMLPEIVEKCWFHLTNSYNSDGQWPPTLPDAPHIIHPFNYSYCFENLLAAEMIVGGIDRNRLNTDPVKTLSEILSIQQELVAAKAQKMIDSKSPGEQKKARKAKEMILYSRDYSFLEKSNQKILYPAEYKVRAEALIEARRLVGGIDIENI